MIKFYESLWYNRLDEIMDQEISKRGLNLVPVNWNDRHSSLIHINHSNKRVPNRDFTKDILIDVTARAILDSSYDFPFLSTKHLNSLLMHKFELPSSSNVEELSRPSENDFLEKGLSDRIFRMRFSDFLQIINLDLQSSRHFLRFGDNYGVEKTGIIYYGDNQILKDYILSHYDSKNKKLWMPDFPN